MGWFEREKEKETVFHHFVDDYVGEYGSLAFKKSHLNYGFDKLSL